MEKLSALLFVCLVAVGCGGNRICVDNVDCTVDHHWSTTACACVANTDADQGVIDHDLGQDCSGSCTGGGAGCATMCPSGCGAGELCCAWSGGACQLTDAGQCAASGGFSCAAATSTGVCPARCYP